jgi:hypothetical protein
MPGFKYGLLVLPPREGLSNPLRMTDFGIAKARACGPYRVPATPHGRG